MYACYVLDCVCWRPSLFGPTRLARAISRCSATVSASGWWNRDRWDWFGLFIWGLPLLRYIVRTHRIRWIALWIRFETGTFSAKVQKYCVPYTGLSPLSLSLSHSSLSLSLFSFKFHFRRSLAAHPSQEYILSLLLFFFSTTTLLRTEANARQSHLPSPPHQSPIGARSDLYWWFNLKQIMQFPKSGAIWFWSQSGSTASQICYRRLYCPSKRIILDYIVTFWCTQWWLD